jgi:hypothetical protein
MSLLKSHTAGRMARAILSFCIVAAAFGSQAAAQLRIGVFDSRAIAIARVHSGGGGEFPTDLRRQMEAAKEKGDKQEMARIERLGQLHQAQLHDQGFGSGSVNALFGIMQDKLAEVAKKENLNVIVSKWELAYSAPEAEIVDVTDLIVEVFHPDERVKKMIEEMKKVEPVKDALFIED